ncbi:MAG: PQQ-binding-like beta-propeller repeat protein [Planctomycetes bacterium]|nr:PQQ-binding-like beta-propeller repeat protein [Planctomycetota bacterium]
MIAAQSKRAAALRVFSLAGVILAGAFCAGIGLFVWGRFATPETPHGAAVDDADPRDAAWNPSRPLPAAPPVSIGKEDWPAWRGPAGNNHARGAAPPLTWSEDENIVWKTSVPGRGHSSPIVLGDRIFLTTADDQREVQSALCLARDSGGILWQTPVHQGRFIYANPKNSHASSTPATDGQRVFALFAYRDAVWLTALALDGAILWQTELGPYVSKEGFGASPLIVDALVIVAGENVGRSWLAAVHRVTGEIVWRISRGPGTSFASPALIEHEGERLVVLAGLGRVEAYDPKTGESRWSCPFPVPSPSASTPTYGDGLLLVTSSDQQTGILGLSLQDDGAEIRWSERIKAEVPSPLYHEGLAYFVQDIGVIACIDADTGQMVWRKRLGGNAASSPVFVNGHVLVCLEDGRTIMLKHGREFEPVHENVLDGEILATPAVSGGRIFLRSTEAVYCI